MWSLKSVSCLQTGMWKKKIYGKHLIACSLFGIEHENIISETEALGFRRSLLFVTL